MIPAPRCHDGHRAHLDGGEQDDLTIHDVNDYSYFMPLVLIRGDTPVRAAIMSAI